MAEPGRPTKLTPELIAELAGALRVFTSRADAAVHVGVDPRVFRRWLDRGAEEGDGLYADLRAAVVQAEVRRKGGWIGTVVQAAANGDVKAAMWLLERCHPAEFGERNPLSLVHHAFKEMEKAAAANGIALPGSVWEQAWTAVARQLAQKLPEAIAGIGPGGVGDYQGFETQEDLDLALELLGKKERRKDHGGTAP
jgi:hypothetical protein